MLWLCDNPCAETPNYRARVIQMLPHLVKLDNEEIGEEERRAAGQHALRAWQKMLKMSFNAI